VIVELLRRDAIVFAGYSAGPCVLAPSLAGLELVDDPEEVQETYGVAPIYTGLGILDFAFVPHFESPGHPETDDIGRVAALYRRNGVPHRTLNDGQAIVVNRGTPFSSDPWNPGYQTPSRLTTMFAGSPRAHGSLLECRSDDAEDPQLRREDERHGPAPMRRTERRPVRAVTTA
jgi:hypothetical protein